MKRIFFAVVLCFGLFSCSIQKMVYDGIAPLPEQKVKPKKQKEGKGNPILAFTNESDIKLVSDAFPVLLKTMEMLYFNDPSHRGVSIMTGQLYIMYANAFIERPAKYISDDNFEKKHFEFMRAKKFYLRGSEYALHALDLEYKNFLEDLFNEDESRVKSAIDKLQIHDVEAVFFGASGILGAFAREPMDADLFMKVKAACLMLEKASELDPQYSAGGIWEILTSFYVAAPEFLGGGIEKAKIAYDNALKYSQGKNASTYITYANAFCVPAQDGKGFDEALDKALKIDPDANPETKLMTIISQEDARWMQANKDLYIYE